jgi:hypothetical protein
MVSPGLTWKTSTSCWQNLLTRFLCFSGEKNVIYIHIRHELVGFYIRDGESRLPSTNWIFKYDSVCKLFDFRSGIIEVSILVRYDARAAVCSRRFGTTQLSHLSDRCIVSKRREPITQWCGIVSHRNENLRLIFVVGGLNLDGTALRYFLIVPRHMGMASIKKS